MLRKWVLHLLKDYHITRHVMKVYTSCFTIMFSVGFTITMVFPYLPFMVKFLLPNIEEKDVGRYSGFLASSFYFGRFCGSYFWGWLGDKHSKKTILMYSGICMAFSSLFFGFSVNFYMAIFFRYMTGLTNGIVGNLRAILCEHSDSKNQGLGMTVITVAWGASVVLGPGISGVIADPNSQYDMPSNAFLEKFPYCLPSMFSALLSITGVIVVAFVLPVKPEDKQGIADAESREALVMKDINVASQDQEQSLYQNDKNDLEQTACIDLLKGNDINSTKEITAEENSKEIELQLLESNSNGPSYSHYPNEQLRHDEHLMKDETSSRHFVVFADNEGTEDSKQSLDERRESISKPTTNIMHIKKKLHSIYHVPVSIMKDKVCLGAILLFALFATAYVGFDECFSLWAATSKPLGGLGFSLNQIGIALSIVGVIMMPVMLIAFNFIERRFGAQMMHHISTAALVIFVTLFPSLTYLSGNTTVLWIFLITALLIIRVALSSCVACQALFLNNSVTPDKLGTINGLALSVNSLFRAISPVVFGTVYSLSLSDTAQDIGFPVDFHLVFLLIGGGFLLTMILVSFFPKRLNEKR